MWVVLSLAGTSYGSLRKVHGIHCNCLKLKERSNSFTTCSMVEFVAASYRLFSSHNMNKAQKGWNTVLAFLVSRSAASMTCNLATGFWLSAIFDRLSTSHFLLTVAPGGMVFDVSNIDQCYDLLVENYEEFTKVKVRWNGSVRMLKDKTNLATSGHDRGTNRYDKTVPKSLRLLANLISIWYRCRLPLMRPPTYPARAHRKMLSPPA